MTDSATDRPRSDAVTAVGTFNGLRSQSSTKRLRQIAGLRARGIGDHINLPQLVVCGDQSAGKSSVLEGITGLPFPRQDGLCTRFATEIVLTHVDEATRVTAEIIPHRSRSDASTSLLKEFRPQLQNFNELPGVIADAARLMGVRSGAGNTTGSTFARDILRINVTGETGLHLSVVDLPGLISVASEEQTEEDVEMVHALVDAYISNPRTIILAVVQASNDIANQSIVQKSRKHDSQGQRTIGIITKPDLINQGTEGRIACLARNEDNTKLKLGFFLLKNPTPAELIAGVTLEERIAREQAYFAAPPWRDLFLEDARVGIANLRQFLQNLLDRHMLKELPHVSQEITSLLEKVGHQISDLGDERPTTGHLRIYLSRLAMRFHALINAALFGNYDVADRVFFSQADNPGDHIRLRASLHRVNTQFAHDMAKYGHTMDVQGTRPAGEESGSDASDPVNVDQVLVSEGQMKTFILERYRHNRGRELPGNTNHVLLTELFHHQSKGWKRLAERHVASVASKLKSFVKDAILYITPEEKVRHSLLLRTEMTLLQNGAAAQAELEKLLHDMEGPPITYNHYYTDNVQNARNAVTRDLIKKALDETQSFEYKNKMHISNTAVDAEKLLGALQRRVIVDMEHQACSEAKQSLLAYYKVARKTFVDNVCIQVVERHLALGLMGIFSPERVAGYSDEELFEIAGEEQPTLERRRQLQILQESLAASLQELRR